MFMYGCIGTCTRAYCKTKLRDHWWCVVMVNKYLEACTVPRGTVVILLHVQYEAESKVRPLLFYFQNLLPIFP